MAVRDVLQLGDPDLQRTCRAVAAGEDLGALVADLADTLRHWRETTTYGRGIAAPQIGADVRVVHLDRGEPWTLVNPRITGHSDESWVLWEQHELDHLDGLLFTDRLVTTDTLCMRQEFELRHRDESPYAT